MVYTTNQARHFYVINDSSADGIKVEVTKNNELFIEMPDQGLRSDLIPLDTIDHIAYHKTSDYDRALKQAVVTINNDILTDGKLPAGQDVMLKLKIKNYMTLAEEPAMLQYGVVRTTSDMTASRAYMKMALSLARNTSRTDTALVEIKLKTAEGSVDVLNTTEESSLTGDYTGIIIKEADMTSSWVRGKISLKPLNFEVWADTIDTADDTDVVWATVKYEDSTTTIGNGTRIADMEYFYMGERGDIYRDTDPRNRIYTEYRVDPKISYATLDIHYSYVGSNESSQKSEKDIIIVTPESARLAIGDILNVLSDNGLKVPEFIR